MSEQQQHSPYLGILCWSTSKVGRQQARKARRLQLDVSMLADMLGGCGCAGIKLTENNGTIDDRFAYFINVYNQHIVFEDSILDGLAPPAEHGIIGIQNSTVGFVNLTVQSCILSGEFSAALFLGTLGNTKPESLTVQDSYFIRNRGAGRKDGNLIWQSSGNVLIHNTSFIDNTASIGVQVYSYWQPGSSDAVYCLTIRASTFRNNSGGGYGCVDVHYTTRAEVSDCSFVDNRIAAGRGAALWVPPP
jgi:hypothetical protein